MILIGRNTSPFTRRIAVVMQLLGIRHERRLLSATTNPLEIQPFNPMIRVPTLVLDDGTMLCDSHTILHYIMADRDAEALLPAAGAARTRTLEISGIAISIMEKAVALFVEARLREEFASRPAEEERLRNQIHAGFRLLESKLVHTAEPAMLAGIDAVCAYDFVHVLPESVWTRDEQRFRALAALSAQWNHAGPMRDFPLEIARR